MALEILTPDQIARAQWRAAWRLLPNPWRQAIIEFCLVDADIASAIFQA